MTLAVAQPNGDMSLGLSTAEAVTRQRVDGVNTITRARPPSPLSLLFAQLNSPVVWLLLVASVLAAWMGEVADAIAIAAIILLNALIGFAQEYRAERAVQALRSLTAPRARVLRDGTPTTVLSADIVRGDVLLLEAGDVIAADAVLGEAHELRTNEAPLTGESVPVDKTKHDRVFMGTAVASGVGRACVDAVGMETQLGKIAHLLSSATYEQTPLQTRLRRVTQLLLYACFAIVACVALLGIYHQRAWSEVLISAISLAVAAIPEGLPTIVTIALALGVQKMAKRNVLVRKLQAVETLGCTTVICTDKTGTLTSGVMRVRECWPKEDKRLLEVSAACCDAELSSDLRSGSGDPTEVAILLAAAEHSISRRDIELANPRVSEVPFDASRGWMSVLRSDGVWYVKGATERILERVPGDTSAARSESERMAARGLRVLAVATGTLINEDSLTLVGLIGIADPPRKEAVEAVSQAKAAGIQIVMITGDHPMTARAIARELGIVSADQDASQCVHARATPQQKLAIVRDWKARGAIVAMTGDGVNDAAALRDAHIGIAMGSGTEVTREASDIVLADDNFASIVAGVREGRTIFDNIRKALVYLLAGNAAELTIMFVSSAVGLPVPLLPRALLWINLVTDGLPALALVTDPATEEVMQKPPRDPAEPMLGKRQWIAVALTGALEAAVVLGVFFWALRSHGIAQARSLAFFTLVLSEVLRAFAARSTTRLLWEVGVFTNLRLVIVVAFAAAFQVAAQFIPWTAHWFGLEPLVFADALLAGAVAFIPVSALELKKLARRLRQRAKP